MIVDDLRRHLPDMSGAQVFRVPYEVCPARFEVNTDPVDGASDVVDETHQERMSRLLLDTVTATRKLVPQAGDRRYHEMLSWKEWTGDRRAIVPTSQGAISTEGWRPPFERMWIASERHEQGAIAIEMIPSSNNGEGVDWNAAVSAYAIRPDGKLSLLTMGGMCSYRGTLRTTGRESQHLMGPESRAFDDLSQRLKADGDDFDAAKEWWHRDLANCILVVATTCSLLSCRNVATEVVRPAEKLQRARARRGELPLVSFHVLKVTRPGQSKSKTGGDVGGQPLALHWVRGHFKRYGEENKLFGKLTGLYWWSPHLAGKADRVALKEYELPDDVPGTE
jgi:hypothetical protein